MEALEVVHPGHHVLAGPLHASVKYVHVISFFGNVRGDARPQKEMDVIELVHQAREKIEILQRGRPVFTGFEVDDANGGPARAEVNPVFGQVQIVLSGAAVKDNLARRFADELLDDPAWEADAPRRPLYLDAGAFQELQRVIEAGFIGEAGLLQKGERGLMDGLDIFRGKGLVLATG